LRHERGVKKSPGTNSPRRRRKAANAVERKAHIGALLALTLQFGTVLGLKRSVIGQVAIRSKNTSASPDR